MSRSMKRFVFFRIYLFCSNIHVYFELVAFVREHIWHKALLMGYSLMFAVRMIFNWLWVYIEVNLSIS